MRLPHMYTYEIVKILAEVGFTGISASYLYNSLDYPYGKITFFHGDKEHYLVVNSSHIVVDRNKCYRLFGYPPTKYNVRSYILEPTYAIIIDLGKKIREVKNEREKY